MERKFTPLGESYWNNQGAYRKEKSEAFDKLVPAMDKAETKHGELLRSINGLYYDYCNNGNCNAVDSKEVDCPECHGSGYEESRGSSYPSRNRDDDEDDDEEEEDELEDCHYCGGNCKVHDKYELREDFEEELEYLKNNLPRADRPLVNKLEEFLLTGDRDGRKDYFSDENMAIYDQIVDAVMYHILTTENSPR